MEKMSEVFGLPVSANTDESVGSVTSADGAMNLTVHELGNVRHFSAVGRVAARKDAAEIIAHAINHVDALNDALQNLMNMLGGAAKECGHEFHCTCPYDKASAALAAYRGEA